MQKEQQTLWDILDHYSIPFRVPAAQLLADYGTFHDGWREHGKLPPQDLLPDLCSPLLFHIGAVNAAVIPPPEFMGYVRGSANWALNFDNLVGLATRRFGPGRAGGASNTQEVQWNFGKAHVRVYAFPPALNDKFGANERHTLIPNSAFEAAIAITPSWCKPASPDVQAWIQDCVLLHDKSPIATRIHDISFAVTDLAISDGFGVTRDATALIKFGDTQVEALETSRITAVRYDRLLPARGGGGAFLSISYDQSSDNRAATLQLLAMYDKDDAPTVLGVANDLAARLSLPLSKSEALDV